MTTIRVCISVKEIASYSVDVWETQLYERLRGAGIPVLPNGDLESGTLHRLDDPADFGRTVYEWHS